MDQTGCPPGRATDRVFFYGNTPLACDMSVSGYVTLASILFAAKVLIALEHSLEWRRRRANVLKKQQKNKRYEARLPIVPALSTLFVVFYFLFLLLCGLNVANTINGVSILLFGLGWIVFASLSVLYLMKFVSLGHRIAPRTKNHAIGAMIGADKLNTFSTAGKVGLLLLALVFLVQFVLLCFVPFFYKDDDRFVRSALGFQGTFVCLQGLTVVNHLQRVKMVIQASMAANAIAANSSASVHELSVVLTRLTRQQVIFFTCVIVAVALHVLVAVRALPLYWFVPFIFMYLESLNFTAHAILNRCGRKNKANHQITDTASAEKNGAMPTPKVKTASNHGSSANKDAAVDEMQLAPVSNVAEE